MPQMLLAALPAIIAAAGTAITMSQMGGAPKAPTPTPTGPPTPAAQKMSMQQQAGAIGQQEPNVIAQTSGFTNPEFVAQISNLLAGTAGQPGATSAANMATNQTFGLNPAVARAFGLNAPATTAMGGGGGAATTPFTPAGATANNPALLPNSPTALSDFVDSYFRG